MFEMSTFVHRRDVRHVVDLMYTLVTTWTYQVYMATKKNVVLYAVI